MSSSHDHIARNQAILNTAIDAIVTIDDKGIIETANRAAERMFGFTTKEMIGRNICMLMPEPFQSEHDGYIKKYLATGKAKIIGVGREVVARQKDGTTFPVHLAVSEFLSDGQRMFAGIVRDISDVKSAQQQLLQSARLAAIGQMVTGLAHESRNALQRAQACLDMLSLDLENSPEQLDLANRTRVALNDLHRLYEEVRGYAAPIQLERRECDLPALWRKVWDQVADQHPANSMQRLDEVDDAARTCRVDVHRMEQVVRNIFENALDACGDQGMLTVSCGPGRLHSQNAVRLTFHDNGPGLNEEQAMRLFEPFFTTKQKGTGLGMAICQRIVEAHGGLIEIDSAATGAKIVITLPNYDG